MEESEKNWDVGGGAGDVWQLAWGHQSKEVGGGAVGRLWMTKREKGGRKCDYRGERN